MAAGVWSPPLSPRRGASLFAFNAKLGITALGVLLVLALLVELNSIGSGTSLGNPSSTARGVGQLGLADSRQLQMQQDEAAHDIRSADGSSNISAMTSSTNSTGSSNSSSSSGGDNTTSNSTSGSNSSSSDHTNSSSSSSSGNKKSSSGGDSTSSSSSSNNSSSSSSAPAPTVKSVGFLEAHPELPAELDVRLLQPAVYGRMQKKGLLHWPHWSTRQTESRFEEFMSWRMHRTMHGPGPASKDSYTCAKADHPPKPYPGCHVFINHNYKYIYIRSPKAASTSIVDEMGECNNKRTRGYNSSTCMAMHSSWEFYYKDSNITDMWKDYFVFGFVRNPWNRAFSLFKYLQSDGCMTGENSLRPECQSNWSNFCHDPWTESDRLHNSNCLLRSKSYMYFHMIDQLHCMVTDKGEWAVDFIGRVEETNTDWAEVVKEINKRRNPSFAELKAVELEPKNVRTANVTSPYSDENAECLNAVSRWYACDIDKLGYLSNAKAAQQSKAKSAAAPTAKKSKKKS